MSEPLVSVIILTYNQEATIARTLDSILAQKTDYPFEIIIGEDASPGDDTRAVCESYAAKYSEIIRLMPKAPNKGILKNYADCLSASMGKYIGTCAGDDWWHNKNKIQLQVEFLESHPDYVMSYSRAMVHNLLTGEKKPTYEIDIPDSEDLFARLIESNFIYAPTVCFRRSMLEHINFNEFAARGYLMEDYPMWLIMSQYGKLHYLNECLVTYSHTNSSASNHSELAKQEAYEENTKLIKMDMVRRFNKEPEFPVTLIDDYHYRSCYSHSLKFADRRQARYYISKVKIKNNRDRLKLTVTYIPFVFRYIIKHRSIISVV